MKDPLVFVLIEGRRLGPYTARDLRVLLAQGDIGRDTECIVEGEARTIRVGDLFAPRPAPAPSAPRQENRPADNVFFSYRGETGKEDGDEEEDEDDEYEEDEESWEDESLYDSEDFDEVPEEILPPSGPPLPPISPGLLDPNLILYAAHPSILSFPKTALLAAAALGLGIFLRGLEPWYLPAGMAVCLMGIAFILLRRSMSLYLISPRRVEIVQGLLAKSSKEIRIGDIGTIQVKRSGLKGWLGVGSVEFASASGDAVEIVFRNVYAAGRVKGLVRRIQDASPE